MKKYTPLLKNLLKEIFKKIGTGILIGLGILGAIFGVLAFQAPSGGDTNPATAGYTSASSWVSTTLTAIKSKTDTITAGSSFCDPNSGKYCNIKPTCDGTEASVVVDSSKGTGFCIEKSLRTSQTWDSAKMTCENAGKRLAEPFEWKHVCRNAGTYAMINMPLSLEWASNEAVLFFNGVNFGIGAAVFGGSSSCSVANVYALGYSSPNESSLVFRCVR